jgi:hypothetical protein
MLRVPVTYQMANDAPPPMRWDEYREIVIQEWERLLASSTDERDFQSFLEQHPSLLPGSFGVVGPGNHGPFPAAVISQPVLPAFTRRIPDFLWLSFNSAYVYPTLIEIESPRKRWFTSRGQPTADLTQARDQIWEWKEWFANSINRMAFYDYYHLPAYFRQERTLSPQYVLIYGRSAEANLTPTLSRKRGQMSPHDEHLMTFDRLVPDANASNFMSAKITSEGFEALFVPPTLMVGHHVQENVFL